MFNSRLQFFILSRANLLPKIMSWTHQQEMLFVVLLVVEQKANNNQEATGHHIHDFHLKM